MAPASTGLYNFVGGFTAQTAGEHWNNDAHRCSLLLDGSTEMLANTTSNTLGFANAWTISFWCRYDSAGSSDQLCDIGTGANSSEILIKKQIANLQVVLSNSAGTTFKDWTWNSVLDKNLVWQLVTVSWDGTTISLLVNGVDQGTADTKTTDNTDTQANGARDVQFFGNQAGGDTFDGYVHSVLIWDVALSENAVKETFNHGAGSYFNPQRNQGDYGQSADLVHWWKFGHDVTDLGKDYISTNAVDVDTNATSITAADDIKRFSPDGGYLALVTNEIVASGIGASTGGTGAAAVGLADSYTISFWLQMTATTASTIFSMNAGDSDTGRGSDDLVALKVSSTAFDFVAASATGTAVTVSASTQFTTDAWYNVVLRKDGTTRMSMYINGIEDAFSTTSLPTQTDASRIIGFGGEPITPNAFAPVNIHSCMMWDEALSAAEIKDLFNSGFHYLNPKSTANVYDSSGNLKHWFRFGRPLGTTGAGGDYVTDEIGAGGIDLTANASNVTVADAIVAGDTASGTTVDFDGSSDLLSNTTDQTLGYSDVFTIASWLKPDANSAQMRIYDNLEVLGSNASRVNIRIRGNTAGDPFSAFLRDDGGTLFKRYEFTGTAASTNWGHYVCTWEGVTTDALRGYKNGVEDTSPTKTTDNTIALTDRSRDVYVGSSATSTEKWNGSLGNVALWSSILSDNEILEIANHGLEFDLRAAGQVYNSQADLLTYYTPGRVADALGGDLGSNANTLSATSLDDTDVDGRSPERL